MKILHIINPLWSGGAEHLVTDMAIKMKEAGHKITISPLSDVATPLINELQEANITIRPLSKKRSNYNPLHIICIGRMMSEFDVIHVHLFPSQYWAGLAKFLYRYKGILITTEHSTYNVRCKYKLTTLIDRFIYKFYNCIVCVSNPTTKFMQERTLGKANIITIENGINLNKFKPSPSKREILFPQLKASDILLFQAARFRVEKNQDCIIKALKQLPNNVHVAFAGDGPQEYACKKLSKEFDLTDRVHFLGYRSDIPEIMSSADIIVLASHWESFGLSAVEGMAMGKPVVASDVEGLAQVVEEKKLLFTPNNEGELAKKLLPLCQNTIFREQMSEYCKRHAQKYDLNITVERHLHLYKDLIVKNKK